MTILTGAHIRIVSRNKVTVQAVRACPFIKEVKHESSGGGNRTVHRIGHRSFPRSDFRDNAYEGLASLWCDRLMHVRVSEHGLAWRKKRPVQKNRCGDPRLEELAGSAMPACEIFSGCEKPSRQQQRQKMIASSLDAHTLFELLLGGMNPMNLFLLVWWWTVYLMYQVTVKSAMLLVYIGFVADGLRRTFGQFGQKVHRVVGPLREYEATYRWDFAFVIAVLMALFVSLLVPHMIGVWLDGKSLEDVKRNRRSLLVFCLGVVLLVADLGLFYNAAVSASWRGTVFSVLALIATCAYGAIVVCVNYFSVVLGEKIDRLSRK